MSKKIIIVGMEICPKCGQPTEYDGICDKCLNKVVQESLSKLQIKPTGGKNEQ